MTYTSLKLWKLLAENGCELDFECTYSTIHEGILPSYEFFELLEKLPSHMQEAVDHYPAYDILNDLCVKYAKEVFGGKTLHIQGTDTGFNEQLQLHTCNILQLLQQGKQEEAETYLWEHCLFNPNNSPLGR